MAEQVDAIMNDSIEEGNREILKKLKSYLLNIFPALLDESQELFQTAFDSAEKNELWNKYVQYHDVNALCIGKSSNHESKFLMIYSCLIIQ